MVQIVLHLQFEKQHWYKEEAHLFASPLPKKKIHIKNTIHREC